ncbi:MAG: hypothetical protein JRG73_16475 [Deltaproteobacteria bacterium]|nr:hypothetical protein [Deltaproteobacteria bacterium]
MARASITVDTPGFSNTALTETAVDAGDTGDGDAFANDGRTYVLMVNTDAADTLTFDFVSGGTTDGLAIADVTGTVTPGVDVGLTTAKLFGPFDPSTFNQPSGDFIGQIELDYTGTAAAITDSFISVFH